MTGSRPAPRSPLSGWRLRGLLLSVGLSAVGYLGFSLWAGWGEVSTAFARIGMAGLGAALALSLVNYGLRFLRWQHYLALLHDRVPPLFSLRVYLAGFALTTTPAKAGEALRSVFLKGHGVAYRHSLAALLAERLSDLAAVVLLIIPGLWAYRSGQPLVAFIAAGLAGAVWVLQKPRWLRRLSAVLRRLLPRRLLGAVTSLIEVIIHTGRCFKPRTLLLSMTLGVLAWGAEGTALHLLTGLVGGEMDLATSLFIYGFAMLVGALSFIPGGLGGTEVTMVALLVLNGVQEPQAIAVTVMIRLATLWFAVALGLLSVLSLRTQAAGAD